MSHYSPVVAALITMLLTIVILISKFGKEIQDIPNERSLHDTPIPRIGGVAMMAGILSGWALMLTSLVWWIVLPLIGLFVVSLLDDMHSLPVKKRLLAHLVAAAILVTGSGLLTQQGLLIALIVLLLTVWMTNLYNFMDGSDGLAGGMALFGFSFYGIAALMAQDDTLAMLNFTIGAAALGFLYNNFHPAKVFMGDAGSIPLGFLAAGMGLLGLATRLLAGMVSVVGVFSVHRGCQRDTGEAHIARRKDHRSAPRTLLSARHSNGLGSSQCGVCRICLDAGGRWVSTSVHPTKLALVFVLGLGWYLYHPDAHA